MNGLIVAAVVAGLLGTAGMAGWNYMSRELQEAGNVTYDTSVFSGIRDGSFTGRYAGGSRERRATSVQVEVADGKVTAINLLETVDPGAENTDHALLFDRVIRKQSLEVDAISGATLTSKAYLKAVENGLAISRQEPAVDRDTAGSTE